MPKSKIHVAPLTYSTIHPFRLFRLLIHRARWFVTQNYLEKCSEKLFGRGQMIGQTNFRSPSIMGQPIRSAVGDHHQQQSSSCRF